MEKIAEEVLARLDVLADKFGTTAAELWPHYVRYQWAEGIAMLAGILTGIVPLVVVTLIGRCVGRHVGNSMDDVEPIDGAVAGSGIGALTGALLGFVLGGVVDSALPYILEPTGAAVAKIIGG